MRIHWKLLLLSLICAASAYASDSKTQRNWKAKCASCHGADGKGHTDQGRKLHVKDMTSSNWKKANPQAKIKDAIENGVKKDGTDVMEGYKDKLDQAQIDALVAYTHKLK
jgi:mono/diheme cytochrome c family protein